MSIDFGSILGGFAEQGVKDFDKAEERMGKLVEKTFDKWLVDGPANFKAHVSKKKALRTLAKRLEGYNLSPDKIGIILEQGRGEEVTKYLDNISPNSEIDCEIQSDQKRNIKLLCRIDTIKELDYYKQGGILQYVLNSIIKKAS